MMVVRRAQGWVSRHPVLSIFIFALVVRVVAVIVIRVIIGAETFGVGDDATYSWMAETMVTGEAEKWNSYTQQLYNSTATFTVPLTLLYAIFGTVEVAGPLLSAFFGAATAALVTALAMKAMSRSMSLIAGVVAALFPSQVLWSTFTLKDAAVWAALVSVALTLAFVNRVTSSKLVLGVAGVSGLLLLLGHLRAHTLVVACWAVVVASFFGIRKARWPRIVGAGLVATAVPWILGLGPVGISLALNQDLEYRRTANAFGAATALVPTQTESDSTAELENVTAEVSRIERRVQSLKRGVESLSSPSSGQIESARERARARRLRERLARLEAQRERAIARRESLEAQRLAEEPPVTQEEERFSATLGYLPKGLTVMLFEPFPWANVDNPRVELAQWESYVWYPILLSAFAGVALLAVRRVALSALVFPLVVGTGTLLVYALAEGNFGTAYRHRGEFVWAAILLAAFGADSAATFRRQRKKPVGPLDSESTVTSA